MTATATGAAVHPVIRVLGLVLFGLSLSVGGLSALPSAGLLLLALYFGSRWRCLLSAGALLRRLRFLFLSLALVYFWLTPGEPLWPRLGVWSPTAAGAEEALARILILVSIVLAVHLLQRTTSKEQMIGTILWLAAPLQRLGVASTRLAVRVTLVLHLMESVLAARPDDTTVVASSTLDGVAQRIARRYRLALLEADRLSPPVLTVADIGAPPWWQWSYLLLPPVLLLWLPGLWR